VNDRSLLDRQTTGGDSGSVARSLVAATRRVKHGGEPTNKDVERHREALGRIAEIGATWVSVVWDFSMQSETLDFINAFAETYLGEQRIRTGPQRLFE
jgi:hypothetical protein